MSLWSFYFGWYQGAVYSNLLASGICAALVWWRARVHLRRAREQHADSLAGHHQNVVAEVRRMIDELRGTADDHHGTAGHLRGAEPPGSDSDPDSYGKAGAPEGPEGYGKGSRPVA